MVCDLQRSTRSCSANLISAEKAGTASSKSASQPSGQMNTAASDSESNDGGEYCICRGPDDHRMMVYCDGGCEDWYHCSCVGIDEDDAKELLDRFICPKCHKEGVLFTTWKRMCRCNNVPTIKCRKAARVAMEPPSKYCSDECAHLFWTYVASRVRKDDAPSIGGALNYKEVGQLLAEAPTAEEFHKLGQKPRLPVREGADPSMITVLKTMSISLTSLQIVQLVLTTSAKMSRSRLRTSSNRKRPSRTVSKVTKANRSF
jgi:COMPASS component SPP1